MGTKSELKEVTGEIIGWDNRLFRTIKGLTISPGETIKNYCSNDKQKILSPIIYCFGLMALEIYLLTVSGLMDYMINKDMVHLKNVFSTTAIKSTYNSFDITDKLGRFIAFINTSIGEKIIFIPLIILLTWLLYKKYNNSFKENSWFALFTFGHTTLLSIPPILLLYFWKNDFVYTAISILIFFTYGSWAAKQFFHLTFKKAVIIQVIITASLMIAMTLIAYATLVIVLMSSRV